MYTPDICLNILVVEDNDDLRESIVDILNDKGYWVRGVDSAEALAEQADLGSVELFIIDLNLPGEDGLSLAGRLRRLQPEVGIIMLTARDRSQDRFAGYTQGADNYLIKPAGLDEIHAAIQSLARRLKPQVSLKGLVLDQLHLCLDNHQTGQKIALKTIEINLLSAFAHATQQRLEYWQVAEVLGLDLDMLNKPAIEQHISRLRKKLPPSADGTSPIRAIRGLGYQLCIQLQLG